MKKEFFVFTDSEHIFADDEECVHLIRKEPLGFPGDTLYRFRTFLSIEAQLQKFDYTFFFNANCICKKRITAKEFLPTENALLVVRHPGTYNINKNTELPYDRNPCSQAYIPYNEGRIYVAGGVNGGKTNEFLKMCKKLDKRIETDASNGVIALWHDESHLNRYIIDNPDYKLLSWSYCFPQGWMKPICIHKILVLDKKKYINIDSIKKNN